ncbi:MAG: hypothetical protein UT66_C0034G0001 [candidate division CPR2 bacterium GW2011_GWC1_39_9]|uniref:Uncharacterized protein n=1 Tax=candidate division CPR2 bacterium GW2011_GWC2_39_10 TaxID=1618345 RepID=A0A0G0LUC2_UNCC2|nr:MAG: hypothetical protein UT18_C0009G0008 [candidate division CPR2 bacterium GW2011_GWC2_39_10]KKR33742.1 MAG: hypothetical protein UT66_C0034G0001 [candidate division CPR2 bacterium GW2011_GWC1_39_9]
MKRLNDFSIYAKLIIFGIMIEILSLFLPMVFIKLLPYVLPNIVTVSEIPFPVLMILNLRPTLGHYGFICIMAGLDYYFWRNNSPDEENGHLYLSRLVIKHSPALLMVIYSIDYFIFTRFIN